VVFEAAAGDLRAAIEITGAAHLGPRRIDAQRDDGQQQVDDPDAEIFAAGAAEREMLRFVGKGGCGYGRNGRVDHASSLRIILVLTPAQHYLPVIACQATSMGCGRKYLQGSLRLADENFPVA